MKTNNLTQMLDKMHSMFSIWETNANKHAIGV